MYEVIAFWYCGWVVGGKPGVRSTGPWRLCRLGPVDIGGADTHCPLQLRNSRHRSVSALRRKLHSGGNFFPFRSETVPVSFRRRTFLLQIGKEE